MVPLALLYGGMGATAFITSAKMQEKAAENGMQMPGYGPIVGLGGLAALLLGGPIVGALGAGLALGTAESWRTVNTVRDAVAQAITAGMQQQAQLPGGGQAQLPGPSTPPAGARPPLQQTPSSANMPRSFLDRILNR